LIHRSLYGLIGTSGYSYDHWWNGVFYPPNLPKRKWLEFYAKNFETVELNVSFYRLPKKEAFESWHHRTPDDFCFAVKGSRFITNTKRLKDCRQPLGLLLDHVSPLREKLTVILWQLPPRFKFQKERLEEFCFLLSTFPGSKPLRHAFEFRDESWLCEEALRILEEFQFAFCIAHGAGLLLKEGVTSDFIYLRFHGGKVLYGSNYSAKELIKWSKKIKDWKLQGKDLFAYFNNDAYGFAIQNALALKRLVSMGPPA
jgi:uncharacterized protein YecE (DUF72 family)